MNEKVPVKQALMMCFYSIEKDIFKKQCGSNVYLWKLIPETNTWRLIVTSSNIDPPEILGRRELPNEPLEPTNIYSIEAENSPDQWHVVQENGSVFDRTKYFEYMIYGENA